MEESRFLTILFLFIVYHVILAYLIHFYVIYSIDNFRHTLSDPGEVWDDSDFFMTRWLRSAIDLIQKGISKVRDR